MERELHAFLMDQCQVCGIRIFKLFQSDKIYTGIHLFLFFWCKSIYPIHAFLNSQSKNYDSAIQKFIIEMYRSTRCLLEHTEKLNLNNFPKLS